MSIHSAVDRPNRHGAMWQAVDPRQREDFLKGSQAAVPEPDWSWMQNEVARSLVAMDSISQRLPG